MGLLTDAEADMLVQEVLRSKTSPAGLMTPQQMAAYITKLHAGTVHEIAWSSASPYVYRTLKKKIIAADPDAWCGRGRTPRNSMVAAAACAIAASSAGNVNHLHNPEPFFMPETELKKTFGREDALRRCRLRAYINAARDRWGILENPADLSMPHRVQDEIERWAASIRKEGSGEEYATIGHVKQFTLTDDEVNNPAGGRHAGLTSVLAGRMTYEEMAEAEPRADHRPMHGRYSVNLEIDVPGSFAACVGYDRSGADTANRRYCGVARRENIGQFLP